MQHTKIPEEPQFRQERRVLLGFFWGGLRGLLMLQTQALDLLEDLPAWISQSIRSVIRRTQFHQHHPKRAQRTAHLACLTLRFHPSGSFQQEDQLW